jgi:hypothetical protein
VKITPITSSHLHAIDPELLDFQLFRFSIGEIAEEAIRKENQKGIITYKSMMQTPGLLYLYPFLPIAPQLKARLISE